MLSITKHVTLLQNGDGKVVVHNDYSGLNTKAVEERYNVKYVGEFSTQSAPGVWRNGPVAVFYGEKHPNGSNYLGVFHDLTGGAVYLTDAITAVQNADGAPVVWSGVCNDKGEVLYSAFRHDYQTHGDLMADGGQEYMRCSLHDIVRFSIVKDGLEMVK